MGEKMIYLSSRVFCIDFFKFSGPLWFQNIEYEDLPDPDDIVEPIDKLEEIVDKLESKLSLLPPWWGILL